MKCNIYNLHLACIITFVASCAPSSTRTDQRGVEILPDPKFKLIPTSSTNLLAGKSFIEPFQQASRGKITSVIQFHDDGKFSQATVTFPDSVNLNDPLGIGFYNIHDKHVELAGYAYDPGKWGYRYFKGTYLIGSQGNELSRDGKTIYRRTSIKFPVSRKWEIKK